MAQTNNIPQGILNNYKNQIKTGTMEDSKLKELLNTGVFDAQTLIAEGILSQSKYDQLYPPPPPPSIEEQREEYINQIRNNQLSDDEIKNLVYDGWFDGKYLLQRGVISQTKYTMLFATAITVDFDEWANVPPLELGRVDAFIFGIAGSGKSCFLAGLLRYADMVGKLNPSISNRTGYKYAETLIEAVEEGRVPPPTATGYDDSGNIIDSIQHIACDLRDERGKTHPITFIEMSGEHFTQVFGQEMNWLEKNKPKLTEYLFKNPNNKFIFLVIDYNEVGNQRKHFQFIMKFLEEHGALKTIESIVIVVTKLDGQGDDVQQKAAQLLERQHRGLLNLCNDYEEQYGVKFYIYKFSLGTFLGPNAYNYDPTDSSLIFNLLTEVTSVKKEPKSKKVDGPWWKKLFQMIYNLFFLIN